jgi:hypothetical protein
MQNFLDALSPGWIGTLIGIIGLIIALATYLLTRKRTILSYGTQGISLIGTSDAKLSGDLTVQYKGIDVPRLTKSIIVFWNEGENTINSDDIVPTDLLYIDVGKNSKILSISTAKSSRLVTQIECQNDVNDNSKARLNFEFLDPQDGGVIEVLHTGENKIIKLSGTIKGLPSGIKNHGMIISMLPSVKLPYLNANINIFGFIFILIGTLVILANFYPNVADIDTKISSFFPKFSYVTKGFFIIIFGIFITWFFRRRYPKALHVEELN